MSSVTTLIYKNLICIFLLFLVACDDSVQIQKLSKQVRTDYKEHLQKLPEIDYLLLFSRKPKDAELELGRLLFSDPVLSRNNDTSCATCHLTNHGFADGNGLNVGSLGKGGPHGDNVGRKFGHGKLSMNREFGESALGFKPKRKMFRNSLSTINVAYRADAQTDNGLLWDGRFGDIFFQLLLPIHTPEELCGQNPLPKTGENIFRAGGPIFKGPVTLEHSNFVDPHTGANKNAFNYQKVTIKGIPRLRPNGALTYPNRNECLALAIAKLNSIPEYRKRFKEVYKKDKITDRLLAIAFAAFVTTHVSKDTPYDKFVAGKNSLSEKELYGLGVFVNEAGKSFTLGDKKLTGAGCVKCHTPPHFTNGKHYSLGVVSDDASDLSRPQFINNFRSGFFNRPATQRGKPPKCHIEGVTVLSNRGYAGDLGRANATYDDNDCFKFRTPTLRNVIETFPYYHHGTERAAGLEAKDLKERSKKALANVIEYHLRGPVNTKIANLNDFRKPFYDFLFQKDPLVPAHFQYFGEMNSKYPIKLSRFDKEALLEFISNGLWDRKSTIRGDLDNDVTHPRRVPSGLKPTITRDRGSQSELPPGML
jgi:cytochrome c peroxidase